MSEIAVPSLLYGDDDSDWRYYVSGHDPENVLQIDEMDALEWEAIWMRPERMSSLPPEERGDDWEALARDERGRFQPVYCWIGCGAAAPGARPFLGVRYRL